MSAKVLSYSEALTLALANGYPANALESGIPSYGVELTYGGRRYQLYASQNKGIYFAADISVFADDGTLLTDTADVYLNAAGELVTETASTLGNIGIGAAIIGGIFLLLMLKKQVF